MRDKLARVREKMKESGADVHVLSSLDGIAWLYNLRGDDVDLLHVERAVLDRRLVVDVPHAPRLEVPDQTVFYGVSTTSRGILFLVEGGHNLQIPADPAVARKRAYWDWVLGNPDWRSVASKEVTAG